MQEKTNDINKGRAFLLAKALGTGLVGGLFWTLVWEMMRYFHMVEVKPFRIWEVLFHPASFDSRWYLFFIGLMLNAVLSMLLAWVYYICCKRVAHWIMGTIYGLLIWGVTYVAGPFLFFQQSVFQTYAVDTHIGFLCLLLLYGVFIGYTISFDYEQVQKTPAK